MGRRPGARNRDYDEARAELAGRVLEAVVHLGARASLHDLARAADVSIPTLKHYFGDRSEAVAEALRCAREHGAEHVARLAHPGRLPLVASLTLVATELASAWIPAGIGRLFTSGMGAGLFDPAAGPGYLDGVLEPVIRALEERLRVHAHRGEVALDPHDELAVRTASLQFLSPLLLALIHQHGLGGTTCRPLDVHAFVALHVEAFARAYAKA